MWAETDVRCYPPAHIYNDIYAGWEPRTPTPAHRSETVGRPSSTRTRPPLPLGDGGWEEKVAGRAHRDCRKLSFGLCVHMIVCAHIEAGDGHPSQRTKTG